LTSESIASPPSTARTGDPCPNCGALLAGDQRYCLECGRRCAPVSSVLLGGVPTSLLHRAPASAGPGSVPPGFAPPVSGSQTPGAPPRSNAATMIAGVGVLLLAIGVGVLIGRSGGAGKQTTPAAAQVIVATAPSAGSSAGVAGTEASTFTDDWPTATNGFTVQLQTLPLAGTQAKAVEAAKSTAAANGAKNVGALNSAGFPSLTAGNYVVYSGVFHKRGEANRALAGLKRKFPAAKVIKVSSAGAGSAAGSSAGQKAAKENGSGAGQSSRAPTKPAEALKHAHGRSYEEKSKNLPDVVGT
jgi:hypothetical protein